MQHFRFRRGQSTLEYSIVCALVFAALFTGSPSIAQRMADSVRSFYGTLTYFLSHS